MKKIITLLFALVLVLSLTACQNETLDAKSVYEKASANMQKLDSLSSEASMLLEVSDGTNTLSLALPIDLKATVTKMRTEPEIYTSLGIKYDEVDSLIQMWQSGGFTYIDVDGTKFYAESAELKVDDVMLSPDFGSEGLDLEMEEDADGYLLDMSLDEEKLKNLMGEFGEIADLKELFEDVVSFSNVSAKMRINKDFYIENVSLDFMMEFNEAGSAHVGADFEYSDFNEAVLPSFAPEEFLENAAY